MGGPRARGGAAGRPRAANLALAVAAAEAHLGRPVDPHAADASIPGRLEHRGDAPLEIWDGAHNLAGVGYLLPRLPVRRFTIVASILADKDAGAMLRALTAVGDTLVATRSGNPRALPAEELARLAAPHFSSVEAVPDPHRPGGPAGCRPRRRRPRHRIALSPFRPITRTMSRAGERLGVFVFAAVLLALCGARVWGWLV